MLKNFSFYILITAVTILVVTTTIPAQIQPNEKWNITGYSIAGESDLLPTDINAHITFADNGSVSGSTGCNSYAGTAAFENAGKVTISQLRSTERACTEAVMKFERLFLQTLEAATQYAVADGFLTLTDVKTGNFLKFKNTAATPAAQATKTELETIYISNKTVKCTGVAPLKCLQIKRQTSAKWQNFYDQIVGFEYKPGKFYKIEVERSVLDPAPQDTSLYRHKLVRVVKASKKESDVYR